MPIEVRELVIKATVAEEGSTGNTSSAATTNNSVTREEGIIKACVDKVLDIIREKSER